MADARHAASSASARATRPRASPSRERFALERPRGTELCARAGRAPRRARGRRARDLQPQRAVPRRHRRRRRASGVAVAAFARLADADPEELSTMLAVREERGGGRAPVPRRRRHRERRHRRGADPGPAARRARARARGRHLRPAARPAVPTRGGDRQARAHRDAHRRRPRIDRIGRRRARRQPPRWLARGRARARRRRRQDGRRSLHAACAQRGARRIDVANRSVERAQPVAASSGASGVGVSVRRARRRARDAATRSSAPPTPRTW